MSRDTEADYKRGYEQGYICGQGHPTETTPEGTPDLAARDWTLAEPVALTPLTDAEERKMREVVTELAALEHRLLMPPHPGDVYLSSALCTCGEWQYDANTPSDLFSAYRAILREHTAHTAAFAASRSTEEAKEINLIVDREFSAARVSADPQETKRESSSAYLLGYEAGHAAADKSTPTAARDDKGPVREYGPYAGLSDGSRNDTSAWCAGVGCGRPHLHDAHSYSRAAASQPADGPGLRKAVAEFFEAWDNEPPTTIPDAVERLRAAASLEASS